MHIFENVHKRQFIYTGESEVWIHYAVVNYNCFDERMSLNADRNIRQSSRAQNMKINKKYCSGHLAYTAQLIAY